MRATRKDGDTWLHIEVTDIIYRTAGLEVESAAQRRYLTMPTHTYKTSSKMFLHFENAFPYLEEDGGIFITVLSPHYCRCSYYK